MQRKPGEPSDMRKMLVIRARTRTRTRTRNNYSRIQQLNDFPHPTLSLSLSFSADSPVHSATSAKQRKLFLIKINDSFNGRFATGSAHKLSMEKHNTLYVAVFFNTHNFAKKIK